MFIRSISLKNWKNFAAVDVECGRRVFLIGPNAAGKSNFLDAFCFLRDVALHGLRKAVVDLRGGLRSVRSIHARTGARVTLAVRLDDGWSYSLAFGGREPDSPVVVGEKVVDGKGRTILDRPDKADKKDRPRLRQTAMEQVFANHDFRHVADFLASIEYRHTMPQLVRESRLFSPRPLDGDPFGRDLLWDIWNTPAKTRDARLRRIGGVFEAVVPGFEDIAIAGGDGGPPRFRVRYARKGKSHSAYDETALSDGTLRLLGILWALLDDGGPLLLEEPELSLPDDVVARLSGFLAQAVRERRKKSRQLLISTHSMALLRDPGVGPDEVLRLVPGEDGVTVTAADENDRLAMASGGLTAADVLLPKAAPAGAGRMELRR